MLFSTDCAFRIGSTHKICQDYGISGTVCDTAYAIIADGCSGSDLSEFGSKLLCKAIENEIVEDEFQNFTSNNSGYRINSEISLSKVFTTLFDIGNKLKMPDYWLDATLAYAVAKKGVEYYALSTADVLLPMAIAHKKPSNHILQELEKEFKEHGVEALAAIELTKQL